MKTPAAWYLWLGLVLFCSAGASCRQWARPTDPISPVAFSGPPTLEDIVYTVNAHSDKVRQLSTESAQLSTAGVGSLRATLALERPMCIRLRGRLIADQVDLGSNNDLFWFWAKSDPEQALYYAYHQQFVQDATNNILPVGPDWLIEAIGLVSLDPSGWHEGPTERPDGGYQIRSRLERRGAQFTRDLVIDGKYGWITEQHVHDSAGRLLAVARCSNHRTYPSEGVSLPHSIRIELPPARLAFQLDVASYAVNQLKGDPKELFKEPYYEGYRAVNLAEQRAAPPNPRTTSVYATPNSGHPHTAYRLKYRGYGSQ